MLGDKIKKLRKQSGMTQDDLAQLVNVKGKQAVSNWENGNTIPTLLSAIRLAEIFGVSLSYLATDKEDDRLAVYIDDLSKPSQEIILNLTNHLRLTDQKQVKK